MGGEDLMATTYFTHAIRDAIAEAMRGDSAVHVFGEDIDKSVLGPTQGLVGEFGVARIHNTPISEQAVLGALIGASLNGLRPVMDFMFSSFFYVAMDQIVNQASRLSYMSGGQISVPIVILAGVGPQGQAGSQHSESPHSLLMGVAGLKVALPSTPADSKGLMASAIRDPNPVVFLMDIGLSGSRGEVPADASSIPLGIADIKRGGTDITVVAIGSAVSKSLAAAEQLASRGVSVEVVDPRTLVPLDLDTILASVRKTRHLVVADPGRRTCGFAAEVAALVVEHAWDDLSAPPLRVTWPDVPVPYSPALEYACTVSSEDVIAGVERVLAHSGSSRV
jgi:pyruvate/2-oxoglutarate/acetoin dehydrogenase E1 component